MKLDPLYCFWRGCWWDVQYRYCTVRYSLESELDFYFTCIVRE